MMNVVIFGVVICFAFFEVVLGCVSNTVTVPYLGTVIGSVSYTSWTNRKVYSFQNIPYAKSPTGDLRFRPPVPITTWNGTLNATVAGNSCPSTTVKPLADYNENCLTLSVYVPEVNSTFTKLPVVIYIHGGLFIAGSGSTFQPNFLLEQDVILVVPQFRLGVLGLLCLHTDEVPGNIQFLDQIMAMRWVQDNIGYFGGNKDQVTLCGQSSGAGAVTLHTMSPLSKGLFHRGIMNSGSGLATWAMDYHPIESAIDVANLIGCNTTNISSITKCMKNATVREIILAQNQYFIKNPVTGGILLVGGIRAVIQKAGQYKFLTDDPQNIVKNGNFTQLPLMGGVTKHEGSSPLRINYLLNSEAKSLWNNSKYLENNITEFFLNHQGIPDTTDGTKDILINTYFPNGKLGNFSAMAPGLIDINGVYEFKANTHKMLYYNSLYKNSYLYTFDYHGSYIANNTENLPFYIGVNHGDDLYYLFPLGISFNKDDLTIARKMVQLWTSFVKNGVPTADGVESWPAMSTKFGPYLSIDTEATIRDNFLYEFTAVTREADKSG